MSRRNSNPWLLGEYGCDHEVDPAPIHLGEHRHAVGCRNWVEERRVAYTLIGDVQRNHDGSGSYCLTLHYRGGSLEVHTVVVSADGSAKVYNQGGFLVGNYPAGTTVVPPADVCHRLGLLMSEDAVSSHGSDTAEAWPY